MSGDCFSVWLAATQMGGKLLHLICTPGAAQTDPNIFNWKFSCANILQ